MIQPFYFPAFVFVLLLYSCAGIEEKPVTYDVMAVEPGQTLMFAAWELPAQAKSPATASLAVMELLRQADALIGENALDHAADKLERLLRIEPSYAGAWSRLAWIALQLNAPERSQQMAQRSNSYASGNDNLKLLNWTFIRQAGLLMNNETVVRRADEMIQQLDGGQ